MAFEFGTTYGPRRKPLAPINPLALTQLAGGFWNAVGGAPQAAAMPSVLPQAPQVNNQMQVNPAPQGANDGGIAALIKAFTAPKTHHFGIGGAEITDSNPFGNPGGDPFKNGFFKTTPQAPMNYLTGTTFTGPDRVNEMALARVAPYLNPNQGAAAPLPIPAGDPNARAFWSAMGLGRKNGYLPF